MLTIPIKGELSYEEFAGLTGWEFQENENFYDQLHYSQIQRSYSNGNQHINYNLFGLLPKRLQSPGKTFGINFTPCKPGNLKGYELPVDINYQSLTKRQRSAYNLKTFDRSAKAYFEVLKMASRADDQTIMRKVIRDLVPGDPKAYFEGINQKYYTDIHLDEVSRYGEPDHVIRMLKAKNISVPDFVLREFVLTPENATGKIDKTEAEKLVMLFSDWMGGYFDLNSVVKKTLSPDITAIFGYTSLEMEISPKIIRRWDPAKGLPIKNKQGVPLPATIFLKVEGLTYASGNGLEGTVTETCFTSSEITGTGILLNFEKSEIIGSKYAQLTRINYELFPQFITEKLLSKDDV